MYITTVFIIASKASLEVDISSIACLIYVVGSGTVLHADPFGLSLLL